MKNVQEELQRLKEIIDQAKADFATLSGREIELLDQLKKQFGVSSIEEGKKELQKLENKHKEITEHIENEYNKLKAEYDW